MPSEEALEIQEEGPPGRVRAAWRVLRGEEVVPAQIRVEWAEYQLAFGDLINRLSAMLARQAKAEKRRAEQLAEMAAQAGQSVQPEPNGTKSRKAELRRRVYGNVLAQRAEAARAVPRPALPDTEE